MTTVEDAVRALGRAGRWDDAAGLLAALPGTVPEAHAVRRDLLLDKGFWTGTGGPPDAGPQDGPGGWTDAWASARREYVELVFDRVAGRTVDAGRARALLGVLEDLCSTAPDPRTALAVRFHLGLVAENLLGDSASATVHWTAAAASDDPDVVASALRHLGGQAADAGDDDTADRLWWESFRLRARLGDVPGALAQLTLLAPSATLAQAVDVWAQEAGFAVLRRPGPSRTTG